jgi:hypothetical protein
MPFVTEYTPTEALFALAEKAGKAQGLQTGAQLALQYQQMENQRRQAETNAYLTQLAQRQQAQRAQDSMALQYAELGQRQAESEFDRVKFNKTYDLQTAIEERKQQESMTPTQQFQQRLALEEAKAKYKQDIEKTKSAEKMELENTRQKNREDIERLKAGLKTGKADTSSLDAKRKDLEKQLDNARRRATYLGDKSELEGDEAAGTRAAQWQKIADGLAADIAELDAAKAAAKQQPLTSGFVTGGVQSGGNSLSIQPGFIRNGYRYKGGNPSDPKNWEKV